MQAVRKCYSVSTSSIFFPAKLGMLRYRAAELSFPGKGSDLGLHTLWVEKPLD